MRKNPLEHNRAYALFSTVFDAGKSVFSSVALLGRSAVSKKGVSVLAGNRFFETLHFLLVSGPRHFWKKPSGISAGRSIGTFFHFLLEKETRFTETKTGKKGFTLVETLIAIIVLSIIFVSAFQAFGEIGFFRTRISGQIDLGQDLHYNVERLVGLVKDGGTLDYEEYFNRTAVGTGETNGHYSVATGFGNYGANGVVGTSFGDGAYLCRSADGVVMGTGGCLDNVFNSYGASQLGKPQRYGQFALQYLDYNVNSNADLGDEDADGKISGDDDDEDLWMGPPAFQLNGTRELYLIKKTAAVPERLVLRWNVALDPNATSGATCDVVAATGSGCLGKLEMLRLVGRDYGESHSSSVSSTGAFDGKIDTWECRSDFKCFGMENTPTGADAEWVSVFPDDINVASVEFFPSPNKDPKNSWKEDDSDVRVAPQIRLAMTIGFSWERRRKFNSKDPRANIATTVSLTP